MDRITALASAMAAALCAASLGGCVPEGFTSLMEPRFHASGAGFITTPGSIEAGSTDLHVESSFTWEVGHGIRVRHAGADAGWAPAPGSGAEVSHPGGTHVACHSAVGDPAGDLCEVALDAASGTGQRFDRRDDLRLRVRVDAPVPANRLAIQLHRRAETGARSPIPHGLLRMPALEADAWTELALRIRGESGLGDVRIVALHCSEACGALTIELDDLSLATDLRSKVAGLSEDGRTLFLEQEAASAVVGATVFHDDTHAIGAWLAEAEAGNKKLFAPPGIYYFGGRSLPFSIPDGTRIRCTPGVSVDRPLAIFRNNGGTETGSGNFLARQTAEGEPGPANISIEDCGFDSNGWNAVDFLQVVKIAGTPRNRARDIALRRNAFLDSVFDPDLVGTSDCDRGEECIVDQRIYISVLAADGVWIEENHLEGGGRIKAGRPGRRIYVRDNVIRVVNDNGITLMDITKNECLEDDCVTEQIEIVRNTIEHAANDGIAIGADGNGSDHPRMVLRDVVIAQNRVGGTFHTGINVRMPAITHDVMVLQNRVTLERTRPAPEVRFVSGMRISRGDYGVEPATGVVLSRNIVEGVGEHSIFDSGGMVFGGPIRDLTVHENVVAGYDVPLQLGIRLRYGAFDGATLDRNQVEHTTAALSVEADAFDLLITGNDFLDSTGSGQTVGQVIFQPGDDGFVEAELVANTIVGGASYGVACRDPGIAITAGANLFADNARADFHPACSVE